MIGKDGIIIAQLTDLHIGFEGRSKPFEGRSKPCSNSERLQAIIRQINGQILKPILMLITGDLVETGEEWSYTKLRDQLDKIECPILWAMGNHDDRQAFSEVFPDAEFNGGFLQYAYEDGPLRIVTLDTLNEGFHGGHLCKNRLAWLDKTLSGKPNDPTLIVMHHPPINSGIAWMTEKDNATWILGLREVLEKHDQIVHITAGHIHRSIFRKFGGNTVSVCPATAPEVSLELALIDPDTPDDRPLLNDSLPGYCLHHWDGESLTTHSANVPAGNVIVKYDKDHPSISQHTMRGK